MTRILVTDSGRGSAISIIRSLGRRGLDVLAGDSNRHSAGFYSRYVQDRVAYPDPAAHADTAVDALLRAVREKPVDLVVPVSEDLVLLMSAARSRFSGLTKLALPDADALAVARDKLATLELARRLNVPGPKTVLVDSVAGALRESAPFGWPIVLKPQASRWIRESGTVDAYGVTYAADRDALEREMQAFEGRCTVMLQEYCHGEAHGVGLLVDHGRPLLAFQYRRLREVPFTGGPSSLRESVPLDATLYDYSVRLLEAVEWTGPAMVEFKLSQNGAQLMEINGRIWGSLALAVKSGVDLPGQMVDLYLSDRPLPTAATATAYAVGVRSRDLTLELSWIASVLGGDKRYPFLDVPPRRQALGAAVRLFDPRDGFDVLSLEDPRPGVAEIVSAAGKGLRRLRRP